MREKTQKFIELITALTADKHSASQGEYLQEFMNAGGSARIEEVVRAFGTFDEEDAEEMANLHGGLNWFGECLAEWREKIADESGL